MPNISFKLRRGTTAQWAANNPILVGGEPGFDTELKVLKVGDGITAWNSLTALTGTAALAVAQAFNIANNDGVKAALATQQAFNILNGSNEVKEALSTQQALGITSDTGVQSALSAWILDEDSDPASTLRAQQDARYANILSPLVFNAVGDDSADDTTELQSTLDSAEIFGLPVDLMGKTYRITSALTLHDGTTIRNGTIHQTTNTYALHGTDVDDITLDGVKVIGFGTASTADQGAVHVTGGNRIKVLNSRITNHKVGAWFLQCNDVLIQGCEIDTFRVYGVVLSQSNHWRVIGNSIHGSDEGASQAYCITATGSGASFPQRGCIISGNSLYDVPSWDAIMTHETGDLIISDNFIWNVRTGIDVGPNGGTPDNKRVTITGNVIRGTTTDMWAGAAAINTGISIYGQGAAVVEQVTISGNIIEHFNYFNSISGQGGVVISDARDVTVTGNVIRDIGNFETSMGGITLLTVISGITISGNECVDTGIAGVAFYNVTRGEAVNIIGNTFRKVSSASMTMGVNVDSARCIDCHVTSNVVHKVDYITRAGNVFLPVMPLSDILGTGQLEDPHPYRDPIARVGSTQTGDTLLAKQRVVTFRRDTTTTATTAAGSNTLTLSDNTGIVSGDTVYVVLDNGSWHGTSSSGTGGAGSLFLGTSIPAGRSVAIGAEVWIVRWTNGV